VEAKVRNAAIKTVAKKAGITGTFVVDDDGLVIRFISEQLAQKKLAKSYNNKVGDYQRQQAGTLTPSKRARKERSDAKRDTKKVVCFVRVLTEPSWPQTVLAASDLNADSSSNATSPSIASDKENSGALPVSQAAQI